MNKGLEALEELRYRITNFNGKFNDYKKIMNTIEQELKALEIIKNKQVQMAILSLSSSCVGYNMTRGLLGEYLEQEEYDFLKEVLDNGQI